MSRETLRLGGVRSFETYRKDLTKEEIQEAREKFVQDSLELSKLGGKLKDFKDQMKDNMAPVKAELARLLPICADGQEVVHEEVIMRANDKNDTIEFYTEEGELVGERKQKPTERVSILSEPINVDDDE